MTTHTDFSYFDFLKDSLKKILPNSQAVALLIIISLSFILIISLSDLLMPVFASVVIAYLLDGLVQKAVSLNMPRLVAVHLVFLGFIAGFGFLIFILIPMLSEQTLALVNHLPDIIKQIQREIMRMLELYPQFLSKERVKEITLAIQARLLSYGQELVTIWAASLVGMITAVVYLFLVPMMVFFFLKDKSLIVAWIGQFMPRDRLLTQNVWREVNSQIGKYIRGKFAEIIILMAACYITFSSMHLNYAILLSFLVGLSVIIPYVGATLVTFPVLGVAFFQWGFSADEFMYVLIAYAVIQTLDGVVLVPLLFSEAVNLHPIAIIVAILFFGGLWGFWGVFFAIPLATVVKAVISAWPRAGDSGLNTAF
ncbi:MAG: AI-2E family transporter [Methylomicrobium sp.]